MSFADSIEKTHEQVIAEEGISKGSLPEAIQKRIRGWNLLLGRLNKYPDDERKKERLPSLKRVLKRKLKQIVTKQEKKRLLG